MATPQKITKKSVGVSRSRSKSGNLSDDDEELILQRRLTQVTSKAIHKFDKKGYSRFTKLVKGMASNVLSAYLGFKDPRRKRREYLIPKDKAAWLEWLVIVAKKRINVEYLTDKELRKVIIRARPNLSPHKKSHEPVEDSDLPPCLEWNENQVGDWISSIGWPQLKETFVRNVINGRRLVLIDCTALNQMGMTDLASMRAVAGKIRELLGTPPPNALRPIMRVPPYERFLHRKVYNGRNYDAMTFEHFCHIEGFNYGLIAHNKNAEIPCTCEVLITTPEQAEDEDGEGEDEDDEHSLKNAPTVEYLVRNAIVRNKTVDQIMMDILENVFLPPRERKYGKEVWGTLRRGIGEGYDDLHLYYSKDKLEFASDVAQHLIDELYRTVDILNDVSQLEKHVKENVSPDDMAIFQEGAMILMEEAVPVASMLALGELDLENMFRKEPEFERFVDGVVDEAEKTTNDLVPLAEDLFNDIYSEAWRRIPRLDLSELEPETKESILRMANEMLHGITEENDGIMEKVMSATTIASTISKKGESSSAPSNQKVAIAAGSKGKDGKTKPQNPQQQQRRSQVPTTGIYMKPTVRHSQAAEPYSEEGEEEGQKEGHKEAHSKASRRSVVTAGHNSISAPNRFSESKRTIGAGKAGPHPPATGESGGSDQDPKLGKGKGKKQPPPPRHAK